MRSVSQTLCMLEVCRLQVCKRHACYLMNVTDIKFENTKATMAKSGKIKESKNKKEG